MVGDRRTEILERYTRLSCQDARTVSSAPVWCTAPLYTTWGDQVYRKHIEEGHMTSEAGSERYLSAALVEGALGKLAAEGMAPGTVVLDEGWSLSLGDWLPDDARFDGSLARFIGYQPYQ